MSKRLDDRPLEFGRYKGLTPNQIAEKDPSYIVWMYDTMKTRLCSKKLAEECEQELLFEDEDEEWHRIIFDD